VPDVEQTQCSMCLPQSWETSIFALQETQAAEILEPIRCYTGHVPALLSNGPGSPRGLGCGRPLCTCTERLGKLSLSHSQ
jgi:hypothetical protein